MSMTIGEATATAQVLHALAGDKPVSPDTLADALHLLNQRTARALQLHRIVTDANLLDAAAQEHGR